MNRLKSSTRLIELYCEMEVRDGDEEPSITKVYPRDYAELDILKILVHFAYPYKNRVEK